MSLLHVSYNQIGIESVGWGESVEIAIGFYGLDFSVGAPESPFLLLLTCASMMLYFLGLRRERAIL